jgi:hypothetical protein
MCSPVQLPPRAGAASEAAPFAFAWPCGAVRSAARGAARGVANGAACGVARANASELWPCGAVWGRGAACDVARPAAAAAAAAAAATAAAAPRADDEANDADAVHVRGWRRQQPGSLQPFASSVERLPPPLPRRLRPGWSVVVSADAERAVAKKAEEAAAAAEAEGDVSAAAAAERAAEADNAATASALEDVRPAGGGAGVEKGTYSSPWAASMARRIGRTAASLRGTTSARKSAGAS